MATENQNQLTLISHKLCPYVQRAVIALEELGIEYQRIDIDLDNPPDWFKRLSPLGKVPVMLVDEATVLFESAVIAEYINDISDGGLLAADLLEKARQRAWIEFASATLDNIAALYSATGARSFERATSQLETKWHQLEENLPETGFFSTQEFSLVDAAPFSALPWVWPKPNSSNRSSREYSPSWYSCSNVSPPSSSTAYTPEV